MREVLAGVGALVMLSLAVTAAAAAEAGRDLYEKRCAWCHGEEGRGDGPAAAGMFPRPRDFLRAEYKIRSTPHGQLPTDEDLFRVISRGLPGTPMPGWDKILTERERRQLLEHLRSLSPRFQTEAREPLAVPSGAGSAERGKEIYRAAKCFLCHGNAGRADGPITTTLNFQWGLPHSARDLTKGWTFKGGHDPRDVYLRITGGLDGTPMGPYQDLLSDQERWDLAHYVASLDREPTESGEEFIVTAAHIEGEIPDARDSPEWRRARPVLVPLAGQVVLDPPLRWWIPTVESVSVRSLWKGSEIGFLLEWNDPTEPGGGAPDSALLQFAAVDGSKPYFLLGDADNPVQVWQWQAGDLVEEWTARGSGKIEVHPARFRTASSWEEGSWRVVFRRSLQGEPDFLAGKPVPILFSVRDGANAEVGNVRALSTWLYVTPERPPSPRPWLWALVGALGVLVAELWILLRLRS